MHAVPENLQHRRGSVVLVEKGNSPPGRFGPDEPGHFSLARFEENPPVQLSAAGKKSRCSINHLGGFVKGDDTELPEGGLPDPVFSGKRIILQQTDAFPATGRFRGKLEEVPALAETLKEKDKKTNLPIKFENGPGSLYGRKVALFPKRECVSHRYRPLMGLAHRPLEEISSLCEKGGFAPPVS